jgi:hypothetical protein
VSLSPAQAAAAHRLGQDVCVVAGPGSGKTRVLTERFCWLVMEKGIDPSRILAITFTEKAATQIKERLVGRFPESAVIRERIERAYVSTIHAFCARLLRENAIAAAIDPEFQVLDEGVSAPLLTPTEMSPSARVAFCVRSPSARSATALSPISRAHSSTSMKPCASPARLHLTCAASRPATPSSLRACGT